MQTSRRTTITALLAGGVLLAGTGGAWAGGASPADPDDATETFVFLTGEEKLAQDVYTTLGEQFDAQQFERIAASETRHLAAMRTVLDSLDAADPTVGDDAGVFDDPTLQRSYDDYVAQGSESLAAAAAVGIAIEEADIAELTAALEIAPDEHATAVLEQQIQASKRHLAAFERLAEGGIDECDAAAGKGRNGPRGQGPQGDGPGRNGPPGAGRQ